MTGSGGTAVTILSGSIGRGHDSVAAACAAAFADRGTKTDVVDCMALLGGVGQRVGEWLFRTALGHAPLYDALHFSQLRTGSALALRMEDAAARRLAPSLATALGRGPQAGGGLLLSVFATGAGAAGRLRAAQPTWRSAVFCTDATAHRLWVHGGVERYLVCSEMAAGSVRTYAPEADVRVLPPPVRPEFFEAPGRDEARREVGLEGDRPCVLMVAGGWGTAPLAEAATALADAGYDVVAVAGENRALHRRLREAAVAHDRARGGSRIVALGSTETMATLMSAADVVVTSAGQTCHEARALGRPLVVLDTVPGHGRENLLLELERGGALASSPRPEDVTSAVAAVLRRRLPDLEPWPVDSAKSWNALFLDAIDDLVDA